MGRVNTRLSWNHKYCVEVAYRYDSTFAMRFKVRLRGERREERLILIDSVCSFVSCRVCCRGSTNYLKSKYGASTSRRFEISIHISISQYISFFKLQSVSQSQSAILLDPFFQTDKITRQFALKLLSNCTRGTTHCVRKTVQNVENAMSINCSQCNMWAQNCLHYDQNMSK